MKKIKLTQGKYAIVDDADYNWLNHWRWHTCLKRGIFYVKRSGINKSGGKTSIYMHRQIMGFPKGKLVDHPDRNGLNCQRYNLRVATRSQNGANSKSRNGSSSKYLGVSYYSGASKWAAQIHSNGNRMYLGIFENEADAAQAYNRAAKKYHGKFARLNKIERKKQIAKSA